MAGGKQQAAAHETTSGSGEPEAAGEPATASQQPNREPREPPTGLQASKPSKPVHEKRHVGNSKKGRDWKYGLNFAKTVLKTWRSK